MQQGISFGLGRCRRFHSDGESIMKENRAAIGGRILTTLVYEMAIRDARLGLASICAAGGMAGAFVLERG